MKIYWLGEDLFISGGEVRVKNSNFVTSNVYANAPDQRRTLHAGHPQHPISNELKKKTNKQIQETWAAYVVA